MPKTLAQTFNKIEAEDVQRGSNLRRFYSTMRSTATLEILETGSWQRAIEVLNEYIRTGRVLEKYRSLTDMYDIWLVEFGTKEEQI